MNIEMLPTHITTVYRRGDVRDATRRSSLRLSAKDDLPSVLRLSQQAPKDDTERFINLNRQTALWLRDTLTLVLNNEEAA